MGVKRWAACGSVTLIIGSGLALAGCGSSSSGGSASAGSGGGSKGTILVASIAGTTGDYGATGIAMQNGLKMAVAKVNAEGGALGKKFVVSYSNDQASPTVATQEFKHAVSDKAVAIFGSGDTAPTVAALADRYQLPDVGLADDAGLVVYPNGPTKPPLPWVWSWGLNTLGFGGLDAAYALKHCPTGLAILHDPTYYGEGGLAGVKSVFGPAGKQLKVDDTITEDWSSGSTVDLSNEITKIKKSGADCVIPWITEQDTARFVQVSQSQGDHWQILGNDEVNANNVYTALAGNSATGTIAPELTSQVHPSAAVKAFEAKYKAEFHQATSPYAVANYDAMILLAKIIKQEGSTSATKLQAGLNGTHGFQGIQGTVNFSKQEHATVVQSQLTLVKYNNATKEWKPFSW